MRLKFFVVLVLIFMVPLSFVGCSSDAKKSSDVSHYTCPMHPQIHEAEMGSCPICKMDLVPVKKQIKKESTSSEPQTSNSVYTCPMHPKVRHDNPGQCPICGMDLVPLKTKKKAKSEKGVRIDPTYTQNIGVKTEEVKKRDLVRSINTHGKVAHDAKLWVTQNEYLQALRLGDSSLIKSAELKLEYMGLSKEWIALIKKRKSADLSLHLEQKEGPGFFEAYVYQSDIGLIKEGQEVAILDQKGRFLDTGTVMAISTMANLDTS